jgi:hypothetical protein
VKLVFSNEEVATALNISTDRFEELRAALEAEGFPKPLPGLERSWSILEVIDWVNHSRTAPDANNDAGQQSSVVVSLHDRLKGGH